MKSTARRFSRPHVKWGAFVGAIAIILLALALMVLNFTKTVFNVLAIDIFIAYGPLVAFFLLMLGFAILLEEFVPSFNKYKEYKAKREYIRAVRSAVCESVRSNERKSITLYNEFLEKNPKYRV